MHHQPHRGQLHRCSRRQLRQLGFKHMGKFRLKADPHPETVQFLLPLVGENQPANHRNIILLHGKVDRSCNLSVDADVCIHTPAPSCMHCDNI